MTPHLALDVMGWGDASTVRHYNAALGHGRFVAVRIDWSGGDLTLIHDDPDALRALASSLQEAADLMVGEAAA